MKNIALFIDLNAEDLSLELLENLLTELDGRGQIVYGKFYNYSQTKHRELTDYINSRGFDVAPNLEKGRRSKELDIRQIVDIMNIVHTNRNIDIVFMLTSEGNVVPVISSLKFLGKYVIGSYGSDEIENMDACNENFSIAGVTPVKTTKITAKKPVKKVAPKVPAKTAPKANKPASSASSLFVEVEEPVTKPKTAPKNAKTAPKAKVGVAKPKTGLEAPVKRPVVTSNSIFSVISEPTHKKVEKVKKHIPPQRKSPFVTVSKPSKTKVAPEPKQVFGEQHPEKNLTTLEEEQFFIKSLEGFANRTSQLNFDYNEDIEQKRILLRDIESFVKTQTEIQHEKDEYNPDIMAILRELGNLVIDIKATFKEDDRNDNLRT